MALTRLNKFEQELQRVLWRGPSPEDLGEVIRNLAEWIGKEIDFIEKNMSASSATASGPIISIAGVSGGTTPAGLTIEIRTGSEVLIADTPKTVTYSKSGMSSPLTNNLHYLKADVYNALGELITSAKPSAQTKNGFTITSPEAGKVDYIAAEFT